VRENVRASIEFCEIPRQSVGCSSPVAPTSYKHSRNQHLDYLPAVGSAVFFQREKR
jgi:hypothetical protein